MKVDIEAVKARPIDDQRLDLLASRLQRACAFLLVLSILRMGSLSGMFGVLASVIVLCCSAPGARGVARAARRSRLFAVLTACFSVASVFTASGALAWRLPDKAAFEVETVWCDSLSPELFEGLSTWAKAAWREHELLHHGNETGFDDDDDDDEAAASQEEVESVVPALLEIGTVAAAGTDPKAVAHAARCDKVGGWVRTGATCFLGTWLLFEIVVFLLAAHVAVVAKHLAVSAGVAKTYSSRPLAGGRMTPSLTV